MKSNAEYVDNTSIEYLCVCAVCVPLADRQYTVQDLIGKQK